MIETCKPGQCGACRKKIGILGFECKCGVSFCARHRLPEDHECTIDVGHVERQKLELRLKCDAVPRSKIKDRL